MKLAFTDTNHYYDGENGKKYRRSSTEYGTGFSFPKWHEFNSLTNRWLAVSTEKANDLETAHRLTMGDKSSD